MGCCGRAVSTACSAFVGWQGKMFLSVKRKCPFVGDVGKGIFFVAVMKKTGNLVILYKVGKRFVKWLFVDNHIDKERKV